MPDLPKRVEFREEGPREGFQIEKTIFPLADRVKLVEALAETGLRHIQVASFVSPKHVPQMADSEAFFATIRRRPGVHYAASG
jgi:hydroxymethylglutaryl-CoA lyase